MVRALPDPATQLWHQHHRSVVNDDKDKPSSVSGSSAPSADKPESSADNTPKVSKRDERKADRAADREQRKASASS